MAKLEIKKKNNSKFAITSYDLIITLDGVVINTVHSLTLNLDKDCINQCQITFTPTDIKVDADALVELQAILKKEEGK